MSKRWQTVSNTVSNLTGLSFKLQTSRSSDERVPLDQLAGYKLHHSYKPNLQHAAGPSQCHCSICKTPYEEIMQIGPTSEPQIVRTIRQTL